MILKILSANDIGKTKSHQAGILVPKKKEILSFFPTLDDSIKNPRTEIDFTDDAGVKWKFTYIYYNNKFYGGTRNEYRLTCTTNYIKSKKLLIGDKIKFFKEDDGYRVSFERNNNQINKDYIVLSNSWITVNIKL